MFRKTVGASKIEFNGLISDPCGGSERAGWRGGTLIGHKATVLSSYWLRGGRRDSEGAEDLRGQETPRPLWGQAEAERSVMASCPCPRACRISGRRASCQAGARSSWRLSWKVTSNVFSVGQVVTGRRPAGLRTVIIILWHKFIIVSHYNLLSIRMRLEFSGVVVFSKSMYSL